MPKSGSCLCGAVPYQIEDAPAECGACHCGMCRRWSGGVYLGLHVPAGKATFTGEDRLTIYRSSDWAERGFCSTCGSNLFYRITAPGPQHGDLHFGFGTLDDPGGISLTAEIFIDEKPDAYAFEGTRETLTGAEVFAMYASPD